jgi:AraC-like DNA-binding protein
MEIESVRVRLIDRRGMALDRRAEGMTHRKSLPVLSVVQALEGSYDIALDGGAPRSTGPGGVFLAPRDKMQVIVHHVDPRSGVMRAQWAFLDVLLNGQYHLEDVYTLPPLLPEDRCGEVGGLLAALARQNTYCREQSLLYQLADVLLAVSTPRDPPDAFAAAVRGYIDEHAAQPLPAAQLAAHFRLSLPTLYRRFQAHFGMSPANYVNSVRLRNAALLLERTDLRIRDVAAAVGFEDEFYFSRLFRVRYLVSPAAYRKRTCAAPRAPSESP